MKEVEEYRNACLMHIQADKDCEEKLAYHNKTEDEAYENVKDWLFDMASEFFDNSNMGMGDVEIDKTKVMLGLDLGGQTLNVSRLSLFKSAVKADDIEIVGGEVWITWRFTND